MTATPEQTVLDAVRRAVAVVLELDGEVVTRDSRLVDDLGADSLATVEIVEILEELLAPPAAAGVRVDDEDLDSMETVGELVDYAVARLSGRPR